VNDRPRFAGQFNVNSLADVLAGKAIRAGQFLSCLFQDERGWNDVVA
jgi:hypothetical protein